MQTTKTNHEMSQSIGNQQLSLQIDAKLIELDTYNRTSEAELLTAIKAATEQTTKAAIEAGLLISAAVLTLLIIL